MKRTVAVVGGDMRQVRLAELLLNDGWLVCTWGLDQGGGPNAVPLDQALGAELLILPLPLFHISRCSHGYHPFLPRPRCPGPPGPMPARQLFSF